MSVLMEDRADLLRLRIELYRRNLREGADLPPRFDHPIIGGGGHWIGYDPVCSERMPKAKAGGRVRRESHHGRDHAP